jgi:hypothetical protein
LSAKDEAAIQQKIRLEKIAANSDEVVDEAAIRAEYLAEKYGAAAKATAPKPKVAAPTAPALTAEDEAEIKK